MREMGLQARRGRRRPPRTTDSRHDLPVAPNLLDRHFAAERPDTAPRAPCARCCAVGSAAGRWLADISDLPTDEGWLYLAVVEDMATREIVGWSPRGLLAASAARTGSSPLAMMADHLRAELCIDALVMALQHRRPGPGLIHHSDRGGQHVAEPYRKLLRRYGIKQSMSRKGDCLDNAPASRACWPGFLRKRIDR